MGTEIERKYLVEGESWRAAVERSEQMLQGYFRSPDTTIRVRRVGDAAKLTIKGRTEGFTRGEWEYPIPPEDASELIERFCGPRCIEKTRHYLTVGDHEWVIDEFAGRHAGLLLAEIELDSEDERFERPSWVAAEVSHDPRYYNEVLARPQE